MELIFPSVVFLLIPFISFSLGLLFLLKNKHKSILPPGKPGWPVIGESLEFLHAGRKGCPEKFISERMKKFSNEVFRTSLFTEPMAVFCGPAGNKFLYSNENKLVTSWWPASVDKIFPSTGTGSNQEESKRMRKLLPTFLKPEALQRYVGLMDEIAKKHLETYWDNKKEVLAYPLSKNFTFSVACKVFLSLEDPEHIEKFGDDFGVLATGIFSLPIDLPGTRYNKGIKASKRIREDLEVKIKQRKIDLAEKRASPTQDILSHMLLTSDETGAFMTEKDIANKIPGLLIGGHDTTSSSLAFIIKFLAELPHVYDEVRKEQMEIAKSKEPGGLLNWEDIKKMNYSWNVACEVMRLAPPLQGGFREALTEFSYAGFSIPKGWKLYWSANSTHKNAEYFPDPEKFDPSRFEGNGPTPYTYVPFGGGPRMCPGKEYARIEMLVFMYNIVRRYKWKNILPNENIICDPMPIPAKGLPILLEAQVC